MTPSFAQLLCKCQHLLLFSFSLTHIVLKCAPSQPIIPQGALSHNHACALVKPGDQLWPEAIQTETMSWEMTKARTPTSQQFHHLANTIKKPNILNIKLHNSHYSCPSVGKPLAKVYRRTDWMRFNFRVLQDELYPPGKAGQDQSSRFGTLLSNKDINGVKKTMARHKQTNTGITTARLMSWRLHSQLHLSSLEASKPFTTIKETVTRH